MSYLFETREIGNYRINVYQDEDTGCPCADWDMLGFHLFNYSDSDSDSLFPFCNHEEVSATSLHGALSEIVCKYVPQKKIIDYINKYCNDYRVRYDKSDHMWYFENLYKGQWYNHGEYTPDDIHNCDYSDEFCDILDSDDLIWLLHKCQHEIAFHDWSFSGYSQGDYVEGFSFCTRERFAERYGKPGKDWRKRAVECMESEVDCIGKWLWGDVIGYTLERKVAFKEVYNDISRQPVNCEEWEEIGSCWGYYCTPDELIENVVNEHDIRTKDVA